MSMAYASSKEAEDLAEKHGIRYIEALNALLTESLIFEAHLAAIGLAYAPNTQLRDKYRAAFRQQVDLLAMFKPARTYTPQPQLPQRMQQQHRRDWENTNRNQLALEI